MLRGGLQCTLVVIVMKMKRRPVPLFAHPTSPRCPTLTPETIQRAESVLGLRLPVAYLEALQVCNGGYLRRRCFPVANALEPIPTTEVGGGAKWIEIEQLFGIGGTKGIDGPTGSKYLCREWGYPQPSVVLSSDGHTAFVLDYRMCDESGEPPVTFVDTEAPRGEPATALLAVSFKQFVDALVWADERYVVVVGEIALNALLASLRKIGIHLSANVFSGTWLWKAPDGASVTLSPNLDDDTGQLLLCEYPDYPWVIHWSGARVSGPLEVFLQELPEATLIHEPA